MSTVHTMASLAAAAASVLLLVPRAAFADDTQPPRIIHEPCAEYLTGAPIEILARFVDDSNIFDPKVVFRSRASAKWRSADFVRQPGQDIFRALIKPSEARDVVEYFIECFDENGNGPARYGAPEGPVRLRPSRAPRHCEQVVELKESTQSTSPSAAPPSPAATTSPLSTKPVASAPSTCAAASRPFYCSPWFWGGVGAVVAAAAGTGTWLALNRSTSSTPPTAVTLDVQAPDPTSRLPSTLGGPQ